MPGILVPGQRVLTLPASLGLSVARQAGVVAASSDWWLAGGISSDDCIFAYQPKGAASYSASLSNLNNPGTGDATEGAAPDWAASTGWTFTAANSDRLITPTSTRGADFTVIVRYQNASGNTQYIYGDASWPYEWNLRLTPGVGTDMKWTNDNTYTETGGGSAAGVMALAGYTAYFDGESKGTISTGSGTQPTGNHYIGTQNVDGSPSDGMTSVEILAIAAYDRALSASEIAAVTAAMEAL